MATFDLQHFFETRQELASRTGSIYAQRAVAGIREALQAKQLEEAKEQQSKVVKKTTNKTATTEKGAK